MIDLNLLHRLHIVGRRAEEMAERGRRLDDGSEETLRYMFNALDTLDYLGKKIDAEKERPRQMTDGEK